MKKALILISTILFAGCKSTPLEIVLNPVLVPVNELLKPENEFDINPLSSEIIQVENSIVQKISYKQNYSNLVVRAECDSYESIYFRMYTKGRGDWSFQEYDNNGNIIRNYNPKSYTNGNGLPNLSTKERRNKFEAFELDDLQNMLGSYDLVLGNRDVNGVIKNPIAQYKRIDTSINNLIDACSKQVKDKATKLQKLKDKKRKEQKALEKEINRVAKVLNVNPMFQGSNTISFLRLNNSLRSKGAKRFKNKFVWVADNSYRVKKIKKIKSKKLDGFKAVFFEFNPYNYHVTPLPIVVITNKEVILGQIWNQISGSPLVFDGLKTSDELDDLGLYAFRDQYMVFIDGDIL